MTEHPPATRTSATWRALDLVLLVRPVLLGPVWVIYAAGALAAGGTPGWDLLFVSMLVGGVYVHNQLTDAESDRVNGKLFLIADGHVPKAAARQVLVGLWLVAMTWACMRPDRLVLYSLALVLGIAYDGAGSVLRYTPWKSRPWAALAANAVAHGPVTFLAGWQAAATSDAGQSFAHLATGISASLPYALAVASVYLATTVVDMPGDHAAGKVTWAVRYGRRRASVLSCAMVAASAVAALLLDDIWMAAASGVALPWAARFVRAPTADAATRFAKAAVTALAAAAALRWPALIAIASATFWGSRAYYRARFGLKYPIFGAQADSDASRLSASAGIAQHAEEVT